MHFCTVHNSILGSKDVNLCQESLLIGSVSHGIILNRWPLLQNQIISQKTCVEAYSTVVYV